METPPQHAAYAWEPFCDRCAVHGSGSTATTDELDFGKSFAATSIQGCHSVRGCPRMRHAIITDGVSAANPRTGTWHSPVPGVKPWVPTTRTAWNRLRLRDPNTASDQDKDPTSGTLIPP